jgi:hypothetical protein
MLRPTILYFSIVKNQTTCITHISHSHPFSDSGHGGQSKDVDGDEFDGFDEGSVLFYFLKMIDSANINTVLIVIYPVRYVRYV